MVEHNGKASLYLKFIGVLLVVVLGLMTFTFNITRGQNNKDHEKIMQSVVKTQASVANTQTMVQTLATAFRDWCDRAPPDHIHIDDAGRVMKKAGDYK